jgi:hypothetical protein
MYKRVKFAFFVFAKYEKKNFKRTMNKRLSRKSLIFRYVHVVWVVKSAATRPPHSMNKTLWNGNQIQKNIR